MEFLNETTEGLIRKYRFAGRIRFIIFTLLFFFLALMKMIGGYSYLNWALMTLIIAEAVLNQPYNFIVKMTDVRRLLYYHMLADIVAITWLIYYMGGLEAPLIIIGYYVVILWAGMASGAGSVFFATAVSSFLFSAVVLSEHFGLIPRISYYDYDLNFQQMLSLLIGNVSFLFAFGYFSAYTSKIIRITERGREEERLRHSHRLLSAGYLVENTAHDVINYLTGIRGYADTLIEKAGETSEVAKIIEYMEKLEGKSTDLLTQLFTFSKKTSGEFSQTAVNSVITEALSLTDPLIRYTKVAVKKMLGEYVPLIMADKEQLVEVAVIFIINSLDAMGRNEGMLTIRTSYSKDDKLIEISVEDDGCGISVEDMKHLGEPFFTTKDPKKGMGLGLATAYGIIERHGGKIYCKSTAGKGTRFTIKIPVSESENGKKNKPE